VAGGFALAAALACALSCERREGGTNATPPLLDATARRESAVPAAEALECGRCHAAELAAWRGSTHAQANRLVDSALDRVAFAGDDARRTIGGTRVRWRDGAPEFVVRGADGTTRTHRAEAVIGVAPLRQYLVPFPGGRWQPIEPAFDPQRREWFAAAMPPRAPTDWGHWSNRGANWNSQCAVCHVTGFHKGWDERTDTYRTTWRAMGVTCTACHGEMREHARRGGPAPARERVPVARADEACAACHARRETITETFRPGASFHDHFRLTLPDASAAYHPDGQVRAESFEYGAFQMSRMAEAGVGCTDCHDPHSGRLRASTDGNALCLSCHGAAPKLGAPHIDPVAHGRHPPGSAGNRCVACHMPEATFMGRDRRHDHSFSSPDPRLAAEVGVPDACATCHADRDPAWRIARAEEWYGPSAARPRSRRARVVARARNLSPAALAPLLGAGRAEKNPIWRAALTSLLSPWSHRPDVAAALRRATRDPHPAVRAAALRALHEAGGETAVAAARSLATDSSRLVRVDAAWVLAHEGETSGGAYEELARYVALESDQPPGALRRGQLHWLAGEHREAERWLRRAAAWDPGAATPPRFIGMFLLERGDTAAAETAFARARARAARAGQGSFGAPMGGPHTGMPTPGLDGR
jgi:predicted CXXCH cytochrome family protein